MIFCSTQPSAHGHRRLLDYAPDLQRRQRRAAHQEDVSHIQSDSEKRFLREKISRKCVKILKIKEILFNPKFQTNKNMMHTLY
jgi:hypothetical protein